MQFQNSAATAAVLLGGLAGLVCALGIGLLRSLAGWSTERRSYAAWALRDAIVDETLEGTLDANDPAVVELVRRTEFAARYYEHHNELDIVGWALGVKFSGAQTRAHLDKLCAWRDTDSEAVASYQRRFDAVAGRRSHKTALVWGAHLRGTG